MQTVKGVKVRCIKLLKNKVYKFARYTFASSFLPRCTWAYVLFKVIDIRKHTTSFLDKKK